MASLANDHIAFIHVPKTGGSWVTHALRETVLDLEAPGPAVGADSHLPYDQFPARFRFGFVREPCAWYWSYWQHVRAAGGSDNALDDLVRQHDFPDFVATVCRELPGTLTRMYEHYLGPPGAIDFVGRYEQLAGDLIAALLASGVATDWERADFQALRSVAPVAVGRRRAVITPALRALIAESESGAIARFGY